MSDAETTEEQKTLRGAAAEYAYHSARFALRGGLTRAEWEAQNAFWFGQAAADHAHSEVAKALAAAQPERPAAAPAPSPPPAEERAPVDPLTAFGIRCDPLPEPWGVKQMWEGCGEGEARAARLIVEIAKIAQADADEMGEKLWSVRVTWLGGGISIELGGNGDTLDAAIAAVDDLAPTFIPDWAEHEHVGRMRTCGRDWRPLDAMQEGHG